MTVTSKGRLWDTVQSLWIVLTVPFFFLNWLAFFYIGFRVRYRRWINWGIIYSLPLVLLILDEVPSIKASSGGNTGTLYNIVLWIGIALWLGSIFHSFKVRKEYLLRLEAFEKYQSKDEDAALRARIAAEYSGKPLAPRESVAQPAETKREPGLEAGFSASRASNSVSEGGTIVDLNNDSEEALAALPGLGAILAKRAVGLRRARGGFQSVDEFGQLLGLKPHVVERIRPLVAVGTGQSTYETRRSGRIIDV